MPRDSLVILRRIGISGLPLPSGTPVDNNLFFQFRSQDYSLCVQTFVTDSVHMVLTEICRILAD
jgi:hypothetical protein